MSPVNDNFDPTAPENKDSALVWHHGGKLDKPKDGRKFVFGRTMSTCCVHDGLVYAAEVVGGDLRAADECDDVRIFPPEEIHWDDLAFESTRAALKDYVRRYYPRVRVPR